MRARNASLIRERDGRCAAFPCLIAGSAASGAPDLFQLTLDIFNVRAVGGSRGAESGAK